MESKSDDVATSHTDYNDESSDSKIGEKLAPFNPSDPKVVEKAIQLLELEDGDIVYDLGCGDGRFLIAVK